MKEQVLAQIKQLRAKNKYSLAKVANGIGYETAKGYYDLESGKTDIKLEHLEKLAKFYGVPIGFFLKLIVPIRYKIIIWIPSPTCPKPARKRRTLLAIIDEKKAG